MEPVLISPANATILGIPSVVFSVLIPLVGLGFLVLLIYKRLAPLSQGAPDPRRDRIAERVVNTFMVPHHRMPRYMLAGAIHITILTGFIVISLRWITLPLMGIFDGFALPGFGGLLGSIYTNVKDLVATFVLIACTVAIIRRVVFHPKRYSVPARFGKERTWETPVALLLIALLMVADMFFQGSQVAAGLHKGIEAPLMIPATGIWFVSHLLAATSGEKFQAIHLGAYYFHELAFFFFLCLLPFGRFFHLITSIPTLFSMKLNKGTVKPVRWGVAEDKIEALETFGVNKFEDFTWKHMLDFYACADCGRCSDQCPANAVGRPLSPRFISIKCRDYAHQLYPLRGEKAESKTLIGHVLEEDEIWSCTTCGACEEECPLLIEYIDKIVDLRRYMVDQGLVPQSLQKPLGAIEKRGNPYGKMEKKRAEWAAELTEGAPVKVLQKNATAETLYFVDSITSFDDRIQQIARATARVLAAARIDFGILGPEERDSGHEVRRFGEEMLFLDLKDRNTEAILNAGVSKIVTSDPHAMNALKNDYTEIPPVKHISQTIARALKAGTIQLKTVEDPTAVYTYHDPCYLGRHNGIYDIPREVIDAIPGIRRVDMQKCRDRSFCCGGGGLMLYYEPIEETRMGKLRVEMAKNAGATVIVTACPFCLVNIEDAIKTSGLEGQMQVVDIVELIDLHLIRSS
ncbi:MAG: (Fe-S)-binding protein [Desulfobacterales bacterium]|nr:(Fe-S)-binding protein [Desulfobacterales bacterium]